MSKYNPWPLKMVPKHLQRPELEQLRKNGYEFGDAREIVDIFEKRVAAFAGSKYAIATDCCTHAMELSLRLQLQKGEIKKGQVVYIPDNTYISAYWMLKDLGFEVRLHDKPWFGLYQISGTRVWDSAVLWKEGMYVKDSLQCLSFQIKKRIPIGRGGIILTDNEEEYKWLKLAVYDGRDMAIPYDWQGHVKFQGWHYYLPPEECARGLLLMDEIKEQGSSASYENYPSITKMLNL